MLKSTLRRIYRIFVQRLKGRRFGTIYPVRTFHSFVRKSLKPDFVEIEGSKIFLDPADSLALSLNGSYEPFETQLIKKVIRQGDISVDAGANIGYYTLLFSRLTGESGRVFAFEPAPVNFALLKKNLGINGCSNVEPVQKAVSNITGNASLFLHERNSTDHRIFRSKDRRRGIDIETTSLDDYFKDFRGKINFIKIDVQGAELQVLEGMRKILKNHPVKIALEFSPLLLKSCGSEPEKLVSILAEYGYRLFDINERGKKLEEMDASALPEKYTAEKKNHTNLLCLRE